MRRRMLIGAQPKAGPARTYPPCRRTRPPPRGESRVQAATEISWPNAGRAAMAHHGLLSAFENVSITLVRTTREMSRRLPSTFARKALTRPSAYVQVPICLSNLHDARHHRDTARVHLDKCLRAS